MRRADFLRGPALVFVAALASYAATLAPGVGGGDSGELTAAACSAGIAHPPGYPLYTLLAHAFTWLPFGSPAWRVNLFSATSGAAAAAAVAWIVGRASKTVWPGVVAGLVFAWSALVWTYATVAEVFALHNLLVALVLAAALAWEERRTEARATACALVAGLALSNHHTAIFVVAPVLARIAVVTAMRSPRALVALAAGLLAGLVPYLWLLVRTPSLDTWGDTRTIGGLLDLLLRREYGTFRLSEAAGSPVWTEQAGAFASAMLANLGIPGLAAAAAGIATWRSRYAAVVAASGIAYVAVFHALANLPVGQPLFLGVTERFWQQPLLLLAVAAGMGLAAGERDRRFSALARIAGATMVLLAAANAGVMLAHGGAQHVADFGRALLDPLPARALLLVRGDLVSNAVRYLQVCERARPDVVVLDQELLTRRWYADRVRERWPELLPPGEAWHPRREGHFDVATLLDANAHRSVHVYPGFKSGDESWKGRYGLVPVAMAPRAVDGAQDPRALFPVVAQGAGFASLRTAAWPDEAVWDEKTWERVVLADFRSALADRGKWLLDHAASQSDFASAEAALAEAAARWQPVPWHLSKNLGLASMRLSEWEPSAKARAVAAWNAYLATAPPGEKDLEAIRRWIDGAGG